MKRLSYIEDARCLKVNFYCLYITAAAESRRVASPAQLHSLYFQLGAPAAEKVRVPLCFNFRGIRIANNVGSRNIAPLYT